MLIDKITIWERKLNFYHFISFLQNMQSSMSFLEANQFQGIRS